MLIVECKVANNSFNLWNKSYVSSFETKIRQNPKYDLLSQMFLLRIERKNVHFDQILNEYNEIEWTLQLKDSKIMFSIQKVNHKISEHFHENSIC